MLFLGQRPGGEPGSVAYDSVRMAYQLPRCNATQGRPAQRRLRIPAHRRLNQRLKPGEQFGLMVRQPFATAPGPTHTLPFPWQGAPAPRQLPQSARDGVARHSGRARHPRHPAPTYRARLGCRPHTPRALAHHARQSLVFPPDVRNSCHGLALCDLPTKCASYLFTSPYGIAGSVVGLGGAGSSQDDGSFAAVSWARGRAAIGWVLWRSVFDVSDGLGAIAALKGSGWCRVVSRISARLERRSRQSYCGAARGADRDPRRESGATVGCRDGRGSRGRRLPYSHRVRQGSP